LEAPAAFTPNATFGSAMQAPSVTIGAAIRPIIPVAQAFRPAGAGGSPEGLRYK
jgi:hypothetical protein